VRTRAKSDAAKRACRISIFIAAALLGAACETAKLERDTLYPTDWPDFANIGEKCIGLEGTYANRGRYVDNSGKTADAWLTDVLAAMPTPREVRTLESLHFCERVRLHLESYPSPARPDWLLQRIVAAPSRRVGDAPGQWVDCDASIQLPRGLGWPWASDNVPTYERGHSWCMARRFVYVNENPGGFGYSLPLAIEIAQGIDETLIVRIVRGSMVLAWARFPKAP
jgi:hypothetical protein